MNKSSFASLKLLSGSVGGTHRSSAQKKWTCSKETLLAKAFSAVEMKNFWVMRPPESATQWNLPARWADSISSSHAAAAVAAKSSGLEKEISSKLFTGMFEMNGDFCFDRICNETLFMGQVVKLFLVRRRRQ